VLNGTLSPENIIFIMTTNHKEILDPALIRPGRIDISIDITKCDKTQLQCIYHDLFEKEIPLDVLDRFREFEYMTAEIILHLFHNMYGQETCFEKLLGKYLKPVLEKDT
jgi:ATP-dependent Zn protease